MRKPLPRIAVTLAAIACLLAAACTPPPTHKEASPGLSADEAAAAVAARVAEHAGTGRPVRLAVVAFAPTQERFAKRNAFGAFFAEKTTSALAQASSTVRLFERALLEKIAQENALQLSGAIDTREVTRIGELAPIDWILTGTYTVFDEYVAVDGRLLQVVSGEILATIAAKVELDPALAGLFPELQQESEQTQPQATADEEPCADVRRAVDSLARDVSTPDKARALAATAMQAPFDTACASIHVKVMQLLRRGEYFPEQYVRFLLDSLRTLAAPGRDRRAGEALRYLHAAGPYDDATFDAVMQVIRKAPGHSHLRYSFHTDSLDTKQLAVQMRRVDTYLTLARKGELGLPVPVSYADAFFMLVSVFATYPNPDEVALLLHCYRQGVDSLQGDRVKRHNGILTSMYTRAADSVQARAILDCICANFNGAPATSELGWAMLGCAKDIVKEAADEKRGALYRGHIQAFEDACGDQFSQAAEAMNLRGSGRQSAVLFCLRAGLDIEGLVPSVESLVADLSSDDGNARSEAALFLAAMGTRAAPAESKVVDLLFKAEYKGATATMLKQLAAILGHVRSRDPKGHGVLVNLLSHTGYSVPDSAAAALAAIGPPAIPALKAGFPDAQNYVKIRIVKILADMGPKARGQKPFLRAQLAAADNDYLRDALEDALASLERQSQ
ncbi:MAG: hypothetical protein GF331_24240 [Chitinivibrionales bacterium]|nr:hypothetical protein [Chitinivibrionales bacterium]